MKKGIALGIAIFALVLSGCAKEQIYSSSPPMQTVSTSSFEVETGTVEGRRLRLL